MVGIQLTSVKSYTQLKRAVSVGDFYRCTQNTHHRALFNLYKSLHRGRINLTGENSMTFTRQELKDGYFIKPGRHALITRILATQFTEGSWVVISTLINHIHPKSK